MARPDTNAGKYTHRVVAPVVPDTRCEALIVDPRSVNYGDQCWRVGYVKYRNFLVCGMHLRAELFIDKGRGK